MVKGQEVILKCPQDKEYTLHRYEGPMIGEEPKDPRFDKYRDKHYFTCSKCHSTFAYKLEPQMIA